MLNARRGRQAAKHPRARGAQTQHCIDRLLASDKRLTSRLPIAWPGTSFGFLQLLTSGGIPAIGKGGCQVRSAPVISRPESPAPPRHRARADTDRPPR
jgi:hypothetical protein